MRYRMLGKTGLKVSEIGLGGEWLERHNAEEVKAVVDRCAALGINILDCWMSEPNVRSNIGAAIESQREKLVYSGPHRLDMAERTVRPHACASAGEGGVRGPAGPGCAPTTSTSA